MVRRTTQKTKSDPVRASEIRYRFSRSGGPGGQHVNKTSTRVEALFDIPASSLTHDQKTRLMQVLGNRCGGSGVLIVASENSRSQWKNREDATRRLQMLVRGALAVRRKRIPTSTSAATRAGRMKAKKRTAEKKASRRHGKKDLDE